MAKELGFDEFMNHSTGARKNTFLKDWKKTPGYLDAFLHTRRMPIVVHQHKFPRVNVKERDGKIERKVWMADLNCWESEEVLGQQYAVTEGKRDVPPCLCPMCRLQEVMRWYVHTGKIKIHDVVFKCETHEPGKPIIIHAGSMFGAFGQGAVKKMSEAQKEELKKHGIYLSQAWKENTVAKGAYVFTIVDANNVAAGVQITTEPSLLGDKVRGVIADAKVRLGNEKGNPIIHPYAMRWQARPNEEQFDKKYHAVGPMEQVQLTPDILKLIKSDPPDLSRYTAPFKVKNWRAFAESIYCGPVPLPWDKICEPAEAEEKKRAEEDKSDGDASFNPDELAETETTGTPPNISAADPGLPPGMTTGAATSTSTPAATSDGDELVDCDVCGKEMKISDSKCPHCGKVYEVEAAAPPPPPPPPPRRSRSEAKAGAGAAAPPPPATPAAPAAPDQNKADDDDVPF